MVVRYEWDEDKNTYNKSKHGIDFKLMYEFEWHEAALFDRTRPEDKEYRLAAVNYINGRLHTVIFTKRGDRIRIISMRRSNAKEEKAYEETQNQT